MDEKDLKYRHISITDGDIRCKDEKFMISRIFVQFYFPSKAYTLNDLPIKPRVKLSFKGAFLSEHYNEIAENYMYFYLTVQHVDGHVKNISSLLKVPLANVSDIDTAKEIKRSETIYLEADDYALVLQNGSVFQVELYTNIDEGISVNLLYDPSPLDKDLGIILATLILLGLYVLIIWELVHRTFAAMIASTLAIGEV